MPALLKSDMTYEQFGITYSMFEDQLQAIDDSLSFLQQRELTGPQSEQADVLRLEAQLNRMEGQIERQFDLFRSSAVAVEPPSSDDATNIKNLMNQVEGLTNSNQLAGATLDLLNKIAATVGPLVAG
jgi:hypothetical protein